MTPEINKMIEDYVLSTVQKTLDSEQVQMMISERIHDTINTADIDTQSLVEDNNDAKHIAALRSAYFALKDLVVVLQETARFDNQLARAESAIACVKETMK